MPASLACVLLAGAGGWLVYAVREDAPAQGPAAAPGEAELLRIPPPRPEPLTFRNIAPQAAVAINAAVPVATGPNPAARPFSLASITAEDRLRSVECLTAAVYYEAAVEATDGQRAVAQVVLNRVRHPAYPQTVCGVVYQGAERATGCQFTFTCDGSLARAPSAAGWIRARRVAEEALAGYVYAPVGWATHYHANFVVPYWSSSLVKSANVGAHIFYRWPGGWGTGRSFSRPYRGLEPLIDRAALARREAAEAEQAAGPAAPVPTVAPASPLAGVARRRVEPGSCQSAAQTPDGQSGRITGTPTDTAACDTGGGFRSTMSGTWAPSVGSSDAPAPATPVR